MSTEWVVTTASDRITLDDAKQGETTFTVTNSGKRTDRSVFEVVPGDGAAAAWFAIAEPQRQVRPAASVSYLMKVAVPAGTAPGTYSVQGRVYSADQPPEEGSVLSGRLALEVKPEPVPEKKKMPWWIWIVIGVVILGLLVGGAIAIFGGGGDEPTTPPTPTVAAGPIKVPNILGLNQAQATKALQDAGLTPGKVVRRQAPDKVGVVLSQSIGADSRVTAGTLVDVEVGVNLTAPKFTNAGTSLPRGKALPPMSWNEVENPAAHWRIQVYAEICYLKLRICSSLLWIETVVDQPTYQPVLAYGPNDEISFNGTLRVRVTPVDDLGDAGPTAEYVYKGIY